MPDLVPFELSGEQLAVRNSEEKLIPIPTPENLTTPEFKRVVIAAYAEYVIEGQVTRSGVAVRSGLPPERVQVALGAPETAQALSHRGVRLNSELGLSSKQDLLLLMLGDPHDGRTIGQKLKAAGVSNTQYQAWMREPLFSQQVHRLAEGLHQRNTEGLLQLSRLVSEGNLKAIQLQFEMNGRWNPREQQNLDIMVVLAKVLESLSRHIKDPEVLKNVAADIRQIAGPNVKEITDAHADTTP